MKAQRNFEDMSEAAPEMARRAAEAAQDVASRAGEYVRSRMPEVSERAQDLARDASRQMERLTGRDLDSWTSEARGFIRKHPLQAIALTIGLGYILGKVMARD
jgi:ElaB/YqjD/DUF883 family membrane-anchored ribosome-binding protein